MKIREIEYSRLFNLENYNNERITLRAEVPELEDPNKVMGELFFKVLQIENKFNQYRQAEKMINRHISSLESYRRDLEWETEHLGKIIADIEKELERSREVEDELETEEIACSISYLKKQEKAARERISELQKKISNAEKAIQKLTELKKRIADEIKAGNFEPVDLTLQEVEQ